MKVIFSVILFFSSLAVGASSYDDDLKELFEITGVRNNYVGLNNVILNQMQAGFFQAADESIDSSNMTEDQKQQVGELLKTRFGEMVKGYQDFVADKMPYQQVEKEIYMPLYKESYTHEEIKELITFYKSPVGKKTIEFSKAIPEKAAKKSAEKYDSIISEFVKAQISENIDLVKNEITEKGIE